MAKIFIFTMSALYGVSALINFIADPFWAFQQSNIFNRVQLPFNEREQKTNYLTYHGRSFDSILIGNSRTTLINQNDFRNMKTFNYAVSAIAPSEFPGYIAYALNRSGGRVNTVYISCSFASANCRIEQGVPKPPSYYIGMAMEPLHRLKMLTNLNLIPYSYRVIKENITQPKSGIHYDRNNIASMIPFERTEQERIFRKDLDNYLNLYSNAFVYDSKHFSHNMLEIIKSNPELKFIAFSPPVTSEMHCLIKKTGLEKQYEQWIKDIINVFGTIHHFEYIHSVSKNRSNFMDANHFYPETGTMLVNRLQGTEAEKSSDFGIIISRENLDDKLDFLRRNFEECK